MKNWLAQITTTLGVVLHIHKQNGEQLTPAEYAHLDAALGDALREDGSTDLERLSEQAHYFDIDAWRHETERGDTPVATTDHS